jgi:hypothetical protein
LFVSIKVNLIFLSIIEELDALTNISVDVTTLGMHVKVCRPLNESLLLVNFMNGHC